MSDDNRVRLDIKAGTAAGHERDVQVEANIGVAMESRSTMSARAGMVLMIVGFLAMLIGSFMYLIGYPDRWYATGGYTVAESKQWVESVVLLIGVGLSVAVYGTALYYFGRHVAGRGRLQHFRMGETMEVDDRA